MAGILHIDMDSFFVSVELLDRPDLVGKPVAVAHDSPRSVVSSASYEARRFGVRSAMPVEQAKQRCPQLVLIDPRMDAYRAASREVMEIFRDFTPLVEPVSVDEAFLDVRGAAKLFGLPRSIADQIRHRVRAQTGLTASVGIATTKFVAKLASQRAKPDGVLEVPAERTLEFLHPLPVGAMWGVGAATEAALKRRAIHTVGDIARTPQSALEHLVGAANARKLRELSQGIDPRAVTTERDEKSIGHEVTFHQDVTHRGELEREVFRLSGKVGQRLRERGMSGRTVALKLRWAGFDTVTRSHTLPEPTQVTHRIAVEARALLRALDAEAGNADRAVRLIGVRVENVQQGDGRAALWNDDEDWEAVDAAGDAVRRRFGARGLTPASLLRRSENAPHRPEG